MASGFFACVFKLADLKEGRLEGRMEGWKDGKLARKKESGPLMGRQEPTPAVLPVKYIR